MEGHCSTGQNPQLAVVPMERGILKKKTNKVVSLGFIALFN